MIHWTPEGQVCRLGLNVYLCKHWFRVIWIWADLIKFTKSSYSLRIRWSATGEFKPKIFWRHSSRDILSDYLLSTNLHLITSEQLHNHPEVIEWKP